MKHFPTYGLSDANDGIGLNETDSKHWRVFKLNEKTTPKSAPKGVTTTTKRTPRTPPVTTTKPRGVPEKMKQGTTLYTLDTAWVIDYNTSSWSTHDFTGTSTCGIIPVSTNSTNSTTDSSNLTTTVNPVESTTTTTTSLTTMPTESNSTTSNGTVEYEDIEEASTSTPEYDYPSEGNSTTPAIIEPVTGSTLNVTSTFGPNMIRKRRKKVVSTTTTPSPNPGVVRIRLRRKKTTIAPVTDTTTIENIEI
uniref:Uncharacterized protein n=1 Tax=Anopheles culicifacies TaxID=139723 RepID=A0A182MTM4_9DIPT